MRLSLTFIALVSFAFDIYGQKHIDSLIQVVSETDDWEIKHAALTQLTDETVYDNPTQALIYASESLQIAKKLEDTDLTATSLNRIGSCYWSIGQLDSALFYFNQSLNLLEGTANLELKARNHGNMANVYALAGNYFDAIKIAKEALNDFEILENKNRIAVTLNNIGKYYLDEGYLDSAKVYLSQALEVFPSENGLLLPILLFNHADLEFQSNNYDKADSLLFLCKELAEKNDDLRAKIRVNQLLAELKLKRGEFEIARNLAEQAYTDALKTQVKDLIQVCAFTYSSSLEATNDLAKSLQILKIGIATRDSLENKRIRDMLALDKYKQNKAFIDFLKEKNDLLESEESLLISIVTILSISILVFIILSYKLYNQRQQIKKKNHELEELNNFKNKLFAIIAHDLRAPINQLRSVIDLLGSGIDNPKSLQSILDQMKDKVDNTRTLMDNLLNLAQKNMQEFSVAKKKFDISILTDEVIESTQGIWQTKAINIQNQIPKGTFVSADEGITTIVLRNLIINAIKFSEEKKTIKIKSEDAKDVLKIHVEDEGVGMSPSQVEKLFTTEIIHSAGTHGEMGSGLGLLLCKDFIEKNGGTISVKSALGKGTTVTFTLPK